MKSKKRITSRLYVFRFPSSKWKDELVTNVLLNFIKKQEFG